MPWEKYLCVVDNPGRRSRFEDRRKITMTAIGPLGHTGAKGYFSETSYLENGQTFLDCSVEAISHVLQNVVDETVLPSTQQISPSTSPVQE